MKSGANLAQKTKKAFTVPWPQQRQIYCSMCGGKLLKKRGTKKWRPFFVGQVAVLELLKTNFIKTKN